MAELEELCSENEWATDDQLGIGGLLFDACRMMQMKASKADGTDLLAAVLETALVSLESLIARNPLLRPSGYRLPFRELGLAIGLRGVETMRDMITTHPGVFGPFMAKQVEALENFVHLAEEIEIYWLDKDNRQAESWHGHLEINTVMLATSLLPQGFLRI